MNSVFHLSVPWRRNRSRAAVPWDDPCASLPQLAMATWLDQPTPARPRSALRLGRRLSPLERKTRFPKRTSSRHSADTLAAIGEKSRPRTAKRTNYPSSRAFDFSPPTPRRRACAFGSSPKRTGRPRPCSCPTSTDEPSSATSTSVDRALLLPRNVPTEAVGGTEKPTLADHLVVGRRRVVIGLDDGVASPTTRSAGLLSSRTGRSRTRWGGEGLATPRARQNACHIVLAEPSPNCSEFEERPPSPLGLPALTARFALGCPVNVNKPKGETT